MKITINKITLQNFKGIQHLEASFNPGDNIICGANQTGKTSIADAITWCLFGKDSKGRTSFGIKTRNTNGTEIPHLTHSVTLDITAGDENFILYRSLVEQWQKDVFKANTTECTINGLKRSPREYQSFINTLIPEEIFRIVSTTNYFTSLPWEKQRDVITALVPQTDTEQIIDNFPVSLKDKAQQTFKEMNGTSISQYEKSLNANARQLQREIEDIHVRIGENRIEDVPGSPSEIKTKINALHKEIMLAMGGASVSETKGISERIQFAEKRKSFLLRGAAEKCEREKLNRMALIAEAQTNIDNAERKIKALLHENETSLAATIRRCEANEVNLNTQREDLRRRWKENSVRKMTLRPEDTLCPTCGQPLPQDKWQEYLETLKATFAKNKAEVFQKLTEDAIVLKNDIKGNSTLMAQTKKDIEANNETIAQLKKTSKEYFSQLEKLQQSPEPKVDDYLDENFQQICSEIESLEKTIVLNTTKDNPRLEELEQQKAALIMQLQRAETVQQTKERIAQLQDELKKLNEKLSAVEQKLDIIADVQRITNQILEEQVSRKFHYVSFRLFRKQVNGNELPYCEATVNGVPFADLNTAARINAGIDIINTLSDFYKLSAPVIIDNAEAVNSLIKTNSQSIKLYVTEDKELVFK